MRRLLALLLSMSVLTGCDLPRDPGGTLEEVRGGVLRVGELHGNEAALAADQAIVAQLAESLDARVQTVTGEAHDLIHALSEGEIDILIGGLPASTPFVKEIGLSHPAGPLPKTEADEKRVLGISPGENAFLLEVNRAIRAAGGGTS